MLQKYAKVFPAGGKVNKKFVRKAGPDCTYVVGDDYHLCALTKAFSLDEHPVFPELAVELADALRHAILVDQVRPLLVI
jgi:hypothetical protein